MSDPAGGKVALADPTYDYSTWSREEKIGVIIAAVATFIIVAFLLAYMRKIVRQRTRREKDAEKIQQETSQNPIPRWAIGQILRGSLKRYLGLEESDTGES
jgi:flagellar biosynthesis/type III secretory pathway M-ring protein FliF/YscJ